MKHLSLLIKPAGGACNMRCRYCFYHDVVSGRASGSVMMTDATVKKLVLEAVRCAESSVSFAFQGGEPTLRGLDFYKNFVHEVKTQNTRGLAVSYAIQTNGLLLDDAWAAFLKAHRFLVGLSVDGAAELHDAHRVTAAGKGTHKTVLAAAALLDRHKADYNILSVVTESNARYIVKTYQFFKRKGFRFLQFIPCLDYLDGSGGAYSLTPERYEYFLKSLFDLWTADLARGIYISIRNFDNYIRMLQGYPPENCAMSGTCGTYFVVEGDGSVYPCDFYCVDETLLGNLADKGFSELLETEVMRAFQDAGKGKAEACKACKHYGLCRGGCRRERDDGTHEHRFCAAMYNFFEYAYPRMRELAMRIK